MVDPLAEKHFDINPYHYCFNNPLSFIDPFGLDTLKVTLPIDRTKQGTMTLTVNGQNKTIEGGDKVLGLGTTNSGENPTRDSNNENGDTPTGEATATSEDNKDKNGDFVKSDGTPVENPVGEPGNDLKATGRYFIRLKPESGILKTSGRTYLGIHGGGTSLGKDALKAKQDLVGTLGCVRVTNQAAATIGSQIKDAEQNKRVFRVIIENETPK